MGRLRHWASALRFLQEFGPVEWRKKVEQQYAKLLNFPNIAATTITDLARWQQWQEVETVANWYSRAETDAVIQRAVIAYLRACPDQIAAKRLAEIKLRDPTESRNTNDSLINYANGLIDFPTLAIIFA